MFLTKINIRDIVLNASCEDLTKIVIENIDVLPERECDVCLLLGGVYMIPYRADVVIELYKKKVIKKIVVSGGIGYFNNHSLPLKSEALLLREYLTNNGVKDIDIIVEDKSKNTFENIINALSTIDKEFGTECSSIMLVTSDFHMRRCRALLEKFSNNRYNLYCCNAVTPIDYGSKRGRLILLKEVIQLISLARNGKIDDISIEGLSICKKRIKKNNKEMIN